MENFSIEGPISLKEAFLKETGLKAYNPNTLGYKYLTSSNGNYYDFSGDDIKQSVNFVLPGDWDTAVQYAKEYYNPTPEFKVGDLVVVLPEDEHYYNAEQGKVQEIDQLNTDCSMPYVLKFSNGRTNCYSKVRLATPQEAEEYYNPPLPIIAGYKGIIDKAGITYGCHHFSMTWLTSKEVTKIKSLILSNGVEVSKKDLDQIKFVINRFNQKS